MRHTVRMLIFIYFSSCLFSAVFGQAPSPAPILTKSDSTMPEQVVSRSGGSLEGLILNDEGKPLPDARVSVMIVGNVENSKNITTDEQGKFHVSGLRGSVFSVFADAPSFVMSPEDLWLAGDPMKYYHSGENVSIRLIKGGVITGTVTDQDGAPVVGMAVRATRIPDPTEAVDSRLYSSVRERITDDRGVYRLYGLAPGKYVVFASGQSQFSTRLSPYERNAPTYYPSSTRDTASVVAVQSGQEATDIDIRYRGEPGFIISGKIVGSALKNIHLALSMPGNSTPISSTFLRDQEQLTFAFRGIANGDYKITARGVDDSFKSVAMGSANASVRNADLTGLSIRLSALASVSGKIVAVIPKPDLDCAAGSGNLTSQVVVNLRAQEKNGDDYFNPEQSDGRADQKGNFSLTGLSSGQFRLYTIIPADDWFVAAINRQPAKATSAKGQIDGQVIPSSGPPDALSLGIGESVAGITINISPGGGYFRGKVSTVVEGSTLPAGLHVFLVPKEKERFDDALRYSESSLALDGTFTFRNLAPGSYSLISRVVRLAGQGFLRPLAWDPKERAKLRHDSETGSVAVEIKPCRKASDLQLIFGSDGIVRPK